MAKKGTRKITLRYESVDGFREAKKFTTLKGARAYAKRRIGNPFDIGSYYAVSADGIGRLEAEGASLAELLDGDADGMVKVDVAAKIEHTVVDRTPAGYGPDDAVAFAESVDRMIRQGKMNHYAAEIKRMEAEIKRLSALVKMHNARIGLHAKGQ